MTDVLPILYSRLPGARDTARLVAAEGADRLAVHASSGVAAAWGFHHYLKYWCGCHVSWDHRVEIQWTFGSLSNFFGSY